MFLPSTIAQVSFSHGDDKVHLILQQLREHFTTPQIQKHIVKAHLCYFTYANKDVPLK